VHISELAQHHVENPREVVSQGDEVKAKIIEVDAERRRLSLSLKRVEGGGVVARADDAEPIEGTPDLDLSEDVFPETPGGQASAEAPEANEVSAEEVDQSIEADEVAPDEPGPGDSDGEAPSPPAEAEAE
jgi:small subunit ribosomal protein S1